MRNIIVHFEKSQRILLSIQLGGGDVISTGGWTTHAGKGKDAGFQSAIETPTCSSCSSFLPLSSIWNSEGAFQIPFTLGFLQS